MASMRVLIAEDQSMVLGALAALLSIEADIEVVGRAANGRDALALLPSGPIPTSSSPTSRCRT